MKYLLLLFFLASSCTVYEKLKVASEKAQETITAASQTMEAAQAAVAEAKAEWARHKDAADTDEDGKVSWDEMVAYLIALLGGGGGVLLARNANSNARKTVVEAKVNDLAKRVSTLP